MLIYEPIRSKKNKRAAEARERKSNYICLYERTTSQNHIVRIEEEI
jgi:hypothetical protein